MNDEINLESVASKVATELSKDFLKSVATNIVDIPKKLFEKYHPNFEVHLSEMYKRNSCVRILCSKDKAVGFQDVYVESLFGSENETVSDSEIIDAVHQNKRCVISANGGAGKTFLMRHLWLETFANPRGRVPIFVELRKLNGLSTLDIESFIRVTAFGADSFSPENFLFFCKKGLFVFILDGFDEVVREKRGQLEDQINGLSQRFPDCGLIVSGRPDERFGNWQLFRTYRAKPFNYSQFVELVSKVPFHEPTKKNFMKVSNEDFFTKHESFLSNPLLAIMMLMTYRDNAEIPSRLNTFYENCFNTLYSHHDAIKDGYFRKKNLDQDSFRRAFSVFCLFTYIKDKFTLNEAEFRQFIEKSASFLEIGDTVDEIAEDFLVSVNLIVQEGTNYSFIHRSFQEYFAAYCATSVMVEMTSEMLELFASKRNDSTFKLAYEIHPSLVQERYLLPQFRKLLASDRLVTKVRPSKPYSAASLSGVFINGSARKTRLASNLPALYLVSFNWGLEDDYFSFLNASTSILGIEEEFSELKLYIAASLEKLIGLFEQGRTAKREIPDVAIAEGIELNFSIIFAEDAPKVSISFSKEYRKTPPGTKELFSRLEELALIRGKQIEKGLISIVRKVETGLSEIDKEFDKRQEAIAKHFDI